ncbi:kirola-like [Cynara cardunculus var. scolymus]|uniref:kirola-like n=1 Tax=Cynara cardunculus var. scolymus TaxID=59895 RepID=UPI000D625D1C|nr:kirola-like [Cynara cardunculus var. scolymus]
MALIGKLMMQIEISSHGDIFHDLLRHRPNDLASITPAKVHGCDILDGQLGAVGSVISWNYTHDGKKNTLKEIIEEVDETNHKIVMKVIEGDLVEDLYKSFTNIFHVEPHADGRQLATWTFEFEKLNASVPYPTVFMDYIMELIMEIDAHHTSI